MARWVGIGTQQPRAGVRPHDRKVRHRTTRPPRTVSYNTDLYPARMFIREDFPAPLGPMMADKWPDWNLPDTRFRIVLKPADSVITVSSRVYNWTDERDVTYLLSTLTANTACSTCVQRASIWRKQTWRLKPSNHQIKIPSLRLPTELSLLVSFWQILLRLSSVCLSRMYCG